MPYVALIHPPIYDFTAHDFWLRPYGLYELAAVIKNYTDLDVRLFDYLDRHHPLCPPTKDKPDGTGKIPKVRIEKPGVLSFVKRYFYRYGIPAERMEALMEASGRPVAVFITTGMTYWYLGIKEVVEAVRRIWKDVPVVLGGVYATLLPQHASAFGDFVVEGVGWSRAVEVLSQITGRRYEVPQFESYEQVPVPAFELSHNRNSAVVTTSRGCPFRCSFCASYLIHPYMRKSPERVFRELLYLREKLGIKNIAFYDDALLVDHRRYFLPLLRMIAAEKLDVSLHLPNGVHVRFIDEEMACAMKEASVRGIRLSLELADEDFLRSHSPKLTLSEFERAVSNLEKAGYKRFELIAYVIMGVPGQSFTSVERTIRYVEAMGLRQSLAYFSPVPHTADFERLVEEGKLSYDDDPLLHNKLVFPYRGYCEIDEERFLYLKNLAFRANQRILRQAGVLC